ncbi:hypothetical protein GCM10011611_31050 [Aliidongia dinghuensis]|uniref:Uncharacterized protein n=1 Tax=Aliidongia dinghuensis TaxID=1867774 RepID=A0A8J3E2N0_9PROT|nr:hypothetical protein [Aliidongia dinghuensis]GGF22792.1 hypothetical protein GCM10011611_31050 [Aliidongia dinghuensis]
MTTTDDTLSLTREALAAPMPFGALAKSFTQSASPVSGITWYDLEKPAKSLVPVITPLRNMIPRVPAYRADRVRFDGMRYKIAVGLDVDEQTITIAYGPDDTVAGVPFGQALRTGVLDGCYLRRSRAFYTAWNLPPVGVVPLFAGRISTVDQVGRVEAQVRIKSLPVLLDTLMPRNLAGALVGYDANGLLTNEFANVVGRVLPGSTNPSYVGGDAWGAKDAIDAAYNLTPPAVVEVPGPDATAAETEAYAAYEAALAAYNTAFASALATEEGKWFRIALCGLVPVSVGSLTAADIGKYLVPSAAADGTITATAVARADLTLGQYIDSFGTIEKMGADGRPLVNVKNG